MNFYSQLARAIGSAPEKIATQRADQWAQWLSANAPRLAIKTEEIEWSGINDYLALRGSEKVSKDDLQAYLRENGVRVEETVLDNEGETKYSSYTLPGCENYREVLLTLPPAPRKGRFDVVSRKDKTIFKKAESREEARAWIDANAGMPAAKGAEIVERESGQAATQEYKSSHWDQPNVIAHIRANDRVDADGKRVLFVEEVQSDWGQEGKKRGFKSEAPALKISSLMRDKGFAEVVDQNGKFVTNVTEYDVPGLAEEAVLAEANRRIRQEPRRTAEPSKVPSAPFAAKTESWLNLALKRVVMMAVEGGYDRVAFVNGQQSADRYDLSKQITLLQWNPDTKYLFASGPAGAINRDGVQAYDLEGIVGKKVAQRLLDAPRELLGSKPTSHTLRGLDLKVGGEGMLVFYDKIVPQALNKLLPKIGGGQLGVVSVVDAAREPVMIGVDENGDAIYDEGVSDELQQPGFDITDKMREIVMQGLPLHVEQEAVVQPARRRSPGMGM